jgi:hypothetical protein
LIPTIRSFCPKKAGWPPVADLSRHRPPGDGGSNLWIGAEPSSFFILPSSFAMLLKKFVEF